MNNNLNLDENTMNNIKNMVDKGDFSSAISQISPEMIESFSKMLNNNSNSNSNNSSNNNPINNSNNNSNNNPVNNSINESNQNNSNTANPSSNTSNNINYSNMDFNNIDPATIMKITSAFGKMKDKNDPRSNLLYSLKPYLRDDRKEKLDQYVNLLNITKITDILKDDKKEN